MYRFKECKGLVKICKAPDRCLFNYVPKFHFFDHYSDWLLGIKITRHFIFKNQSNCCAKLNRSVMNNMNLEWLFYCYDIILKG